MDKKTKKFVIGLLVCLSLILNGVFFYGYSIVNNELIQANQENQEMKRKNEEVNREKKKIEEKYLAETKEKEELLVKYEEQEEENKMNLQSVGILAKQNKNLENKVDNLTKAMQYKPYFEENKKFLTEEKQYLYNFFKMIEKGEEVEFDISGSRKENLMLKRITDVIYYPLKSRMFNLIQNGEKGRLVYDQKNIDNYDDFLKEISEYYFSLDIKNMTEKEIIKDFSRKIATDFSFDYEGDKENNDIFNNSAMSIIGEKKMVCTGYTHMLKTLLDMAHIKNTNVLAYMPDDEINHIWNRVTLSNGEVYYVDLTWADFEARGVYDEHYILNKSIDFDDGKRTHVTVADIENYEKIRDIFYGKRD